ncbi:hypothetical protein [Streptomyces sp. NPDC049881]|uniref:hypothetical protein n=1 Tax=Streptomyces sp. NPDC049881 TaxID=3155778 RepID=UPI003442CA66
MPDTSVSARAGRIEQYPAQCAVAVGAEAAAFGGVPAAPVALCTGQEEVVDGRTDDLAVLPDAGGPSMAAHSGCAVVTDVITPVSRLMTLPRVP